ncbi:MAG: GIY-YIG nuclease family protein [Alphaproteobacteria bacterium]|nr:GIY-YIG nuclease family protein [Alphaproteobacteria bacterium]
MLLFGKHTWRGESGRRYVFHCALTKNGIPNDSGGIYMFIKRYFGFYLHVLYVGKAANLRSRLLGHEKWGKAWWILGATERYTMRVKTEEERVMIEEDLIRSLRPKMNDIQMPRSEDDAPNTPQLRRKWLWRRKVANAIASLWGGGKKRARAGHGSGSSGHDYWNRHRHA